MQFDTVSQTKLNIYEIKKDTYIRTIHKYLPEVSSSQIEDILVTELNWKNENAIQVGELLDRLNNGRPFRGGAKTGLAQYYKGWKEKLKVEMKKK